jgi:hypothetical protein
MCCPYIEVGLSQGTQRVVGRPAIEWLDSAEGDLKALVIRNWRRNSQIRDRWRTFVKETEVRRELQRPQKKKMKILPFILFIVYLISILELHVVANFELREGRCVDINVLAPVN